MRLLGSNLLPFTVAQMPSNWTTGLEVEAYFFEGSMPDDLSAYYNDHRKLIEDSVAASRIVLQPTADGLVLMQQNSYGVKAVYGSVYDPKLGVTIHYPKNIIPRRTNASSSTLDIDAAYATDLVTGNKKMKQHISLGLYSGFPVGTVRQLADFVGNFTAQIATMCDLVFDGVKSFDALLADDPAKANVATINISAQGSGAGSSPIGTQGTFTVPANYNTNAFGTTISSDILRCYGSIVNTSRRPIPVSIGDKSSAAISKTIGYAILLIPDSNFGSLAVGNYDIRFMATKVGVTGAGELIELEKLTLTSGEFAEVTQVRTSTLLTPDDPNAPIETSGSGIYNVFNKETGNTTKAYIDADTDGGPWLLIGSWQTLDTATDAQRKYSETIQKGKTVRPYAQTVDSTKPVFSENFTNKSDEWMFTDDLAGWVNLYGTYQIGTTLAADKTVLGATEAIALRTSIGDKVAYARGAGWGVDSDLTAYNFALWTTTGNGGPCGGANVVGSSKICPTFGDWNGATNHCDGAGNKKLWLRMSKENFTLAGKQSKTYAEFIAASDSLTKQDQTSVFGSVTGARAIDFTNTQSGTMWGTPYGSYFTYDSNSGVSIIHCCPDRDVFDEIAITSKRRVVVVLQQEGTIASFASLARNGFTSSSYGSFTALSIRKFVYWDYKLGAMMQSNPYSKSDPVAWDGTF